MEGSHFVWNNAEVKLANACLQVAKISVSKKTEPSSTSTVAVVYHFYI